MKKQITILIIIIIQLLLLICGYHCQNCNQESLDIIIDLPKGFYLTNKVTNNNVISYSLLTKSPTHAPSFAPTTSSPTKTKTNAPSLSPTTTSPTLSPITTSPTLSPITTSPTLSPTSSPANEAREILFFVSNNGYNGNVDAFSVCANHPEILGGKKSCKPGGLKYPVIIDHPRESLDVLDIFNNNNYDSRIVGRTGLTICEKYSDYLGNGNCVNTIATAHGSPCLQSLVHAGGINGNCDNYTRSDNAFATFGRCDDFGAQQMRGGGLSVCSLVVNVLCACEAVDAFDPVIEMMLDGAQSSRVENNSPTVGPFNQFGGISFAFDLDNDGYDDYVIGDTGFNSYEGKFWIIFGNKTKFDGLHNIADTIFDGTNGIEVVYPGATNFAYKFRKIKDMNEDGFDELAIYHGRGSAIIYGRSKRFNTGVIDVSTLPTKEAARVETHAGGGQQGYVAALDFNGDGEMDIAIGHGGFNSQRGLIYLVYSIAKRNESLVYIPNLTDKDYFVIQGETTGSYFGNFIDGYDMNLDGYDDLIIGCSRCNSDGLINNGAVYIIYGNGTSPTFDMQINELELQGGLNVTRINGVINGDEFGYEVSVCDTNGDKIPDLVASSFEHDSRLPNEYQGVGGVYIIYGSENGFAANLNLSSIYYGEGNGFLVEDNEAWSTSYVVFCYDFNQDGLDDVFFTGENASQNNERYAGNVYVYFSKPINEPFIYLHELNGIEGFEVHGEDGSDNFGYSIAAGDFDNNGKIDLIVGARNGGTNGHGAAYIVYF